MKTLKTLGLAFAPLLIVISTSAVAKKVQRGRAKVGVNLQTDIKFNASTLYGQYQTPAEAMAKVEDEKSLDDLLIPRTHFKDRMAFETQGNR
ncbi:MAG: hypothetical protein CL676_11435 [Bdellovibrionaceae bacterium]|nr:hypothetical protein [Pseudobdellovibrionaceae bacterium]|tara:strand:- start:95 stop:370 length:276 start_codon:yes stop_codon:yes gene_type:complete